MFIAKIVAKSLKGNFNIENISTHPSPLSSMNAR